MSLETDVWEARSTFWGEQKYPGVGAKEGPQNQIHWDGMIFVALKMILGTLLYGRGEIPGGEGLARAEAFTVIATVAFASSTQQQLDPTWRLWRGRRLALDEETRQRRRQVQRLWVLSLVGLYQLLLIDSSGNPRTGAILPVPIYGQPLLHVIFSICCFWSLYVWGEPRGSKELPSKRTLDWSVWYISLTTIVSRSIQFPANDIIFFFFTAE